MALRLRGATSGYIELKAPASAGDNTLTLPVNNGSANQLLKTDGSGNLSWTNDNSGVSLSGSTNNTIATVTGANALAGEANLTFDGTTLKAETGNPVFELSGTTANGGNTFIHINANANHWVLGGDNYTSQNLFVIKEGTPASSTHRFCINNSGNVGIGTTSPDQILECSQSTGTTLIKAAVGGNSRVGFEIEKTGATTQTWRIQDGQSGNGLLEIYDQTDSRSVMSFDGSGKVGIGTTSPAEKLDVAGNINLPNVNTWIKGNGHSVLQVDATRTYFYGGTDGIQFRKADNSTEIISVDNNGGMLLKGTLICEKSASSSTTPLTVRNNTGDAAADCRLSVRVYSNYGGDPYIHFDSGGTNFIVGQRWMGTTNNYLVLGPGESPAGGVTGGIYVLGNGKIGINTSGGSRRLNVSDTSSIQIWTYGNCAAHASMQHQSSTNSGTQYYCLYTRLDGSWDGYMVSSTDGQITLANNSDYRLKDNVFSMSNGIDIVKKLNPITYKWKASTGRDTSVTMQGFFAHEVDEAGVIGAVDGSKDGVWDTAENPEDAAVGDPRYQGLSLERLIPALTAALKEAITKIEVLETKVATLESA